MREMRIKKLEGILAKLSKDLVEKYDSKNLKLWEKLNKELEIQQAYDQHESK